MACPCPMCQEQFSNILLLTEHLQVQHKIVNDQTFWSYTANQGVGNESESMLKKYPEEETAQTNQFTSKEVENNMYQHKLKISGGKRLIPPPYEHQGEIGKVDEIPEGDKNQYPVNVQSKIVQVPPRPDPTRNKNNIPIEKDCKNEDPSTEATPIGRAHNQPDDRLKEEYDSGASTNEDHDLNLNGKGTDASTGDSNLNYLNANTDSRSIKHDEPPEESLKGHFLLTSKGVKFPKAKPEDFSEAVHEMPVKVKLEEGDADTTHSDDDAMEYNTQNTIKNKKENRPTSGSNEENSSNRTTQGDSLKEESSEDKVLDPMDIKEEREDYVPMDTVDIKNVPITNSIYIKIDDKVKIQHWTGQDLITFDPEDVSPGTTKCPICNKQFKQHQWMTKHLRLTHKFLLSKVNPTPLLLISPGSFKCPECHEEFQDYHLVSQHIRYIHNSFNIKDTSKHSVDIEVPCDVCQKVFKNLKRLEIHKNLFHTFVECVCDLCGMKFESKGKLISHKLDHAASNKKAEICHICNKSVKGMKRHIEDKHSTGLDTVMCSLCPKTFKNQRYLRGHMYKTHADPSQAKACPHCAKVLKNDSIYKRHIKFVHSENEVVYCEECGKQFQNKAYLRSHVKTVHGPDTSEAQVCHICSKSVKGAKSMKRHLEDMHSSGTELVQCSMCPKTFKNYRRMRGHIYSTHTDPSQTVLCAYCPTVLKNGNIYKQHIRMVHGVSDPVTCEKCGKQFPHKANLTTHEKTVHAADACYCDHCGKHYKNSTALKKHSMKYHSDVEKKPARDEVLIKSSNYEDNFLTSQTHPHPNPTEKKPMRDEVLIKSSNYDDIFPSSHTQQPLHHLEKKQVRDEVSTKNSNYEESFPKSQIPPPLQHIEKKSVRDEGFIKNSNYQDIYPTSHLPQHLHHMEKKQARDEVLIKNLNYQDIYHPASHTPQHHHHSEKKQVRDDVLIKNSNYEDIYHPTSHNPQHLHHSEKRPVRDEVLVKNSNYQDMYPSSHIPHHLRHELGTQNLEKNTF